MHDTSVTLDEYTVVRFENNAAENGGALTLYGSWITVSIHCKLIFINNTAVGFGGAIYVLMTEEVYLPYSHSCFIEVLNFICLVFSIHTFHSVRTQIKGIPMQFMPPLSFPVFIV